MTHLASRAIVASMLLAVLILPLSAHHGAAFLNKAMEMNTAEVRFAELAVNKAQNARVKEFAQMLVQDHKQAMTKINDLRNARLATSINGSTLSDRALKNVADAPLTAEHRRSLERLTSLSGADFDSEFAKLMVNEHREAIRMFEAQTRVHGNAAAKAAPNATRQKPSDQRSSTADLAKDVDTAEFAQATLPTLRHHLEQAQSIQIELVGK